MSLKNIYWQYFSRMWTKIKSANFKDEYFSGNQHIFAFNKVTFAPNFCAMAAVASSSTPAKTGKSDKEQQIQIRLKTVHSEYAVPDTTLSVPVSVESEALNNLVRSLLQKDDDEVPTFDFIIADDLLRTDLDVFLTSHDEISREIVLEILYVEQQSPPKPKKNVSHEDWVAGVSAMGNYIVSACYDNTVSLWLNPVKSAEVESGTKLLTIPSHQGPVRSVAWISLDEEYGTFASTSHDQVSFDLKCCFDSKT